MAGFKSPDFSSLMTRDELVTALLMVDDTSHTNTVWTELSNEYKALRGTPREQLLVGVNPEVKVIPEMELSIAALREYSIEYLKKVP